MTVMKKISISTPFFQRRFGERGALDAAREVGAEGVDFCLCDFYDYRNENCIYARSDREIEEHFAALGEYARALGLSVVQTHGRISGYRNEPVEDAALIKNARLDCLATRALGAKVCVMHTVSNSVFGADAPAELMHRMNDEFYLAVLPFAREFDIRIATETYGICGTTKTCELFGVIPEFIAAYDRLSAHPELGKYLTVCLDTGHTHNATQFPGNLSVGEAVRRLGSRIEVLHLHDNDGKCDGHTLPLAGTADWRDILAALSEVGYAGYYNLEVSFEKFGAELAKETAAFAVKVMRSLLEKYGN